MIQFCGQEVVVEKDFRTRGMRLGVNAEGQVAVWLGYLSNYSDDEIRDFLKSMNAF